MNMGYSVYEIEMGYGMDWSVHVARNYNVSCSCMDRNSGSTFNVRMS